MDLHVLLEARQLKVHPLTFEVADGHVSTDATADLRRDVIHATGEAKVSGVELARVFPKLTRSDGTAGKVAGVARLTADGNSPAALFGHLNGDAAFIDVGGKASTLHLAMTNLQLVSGAESLFRRSKDADVNCLAAHLVAKDGVVNVATLVTDTSAQTIQGSGSIDLRNEQYDLTLHARPKQLSLFALHAPLLIRGPIRHPQIGPAPGAVAAQAGGSIVLGALATPLAAPIPLMDLGDKEQSHCPLLRNRVLNSAASSAPSRQTGRP